ncbi:hypothetical protein EW145_g2529 [Phellinidium pouzarii]|uniref:Dicer-like protein 1 n=1 Tax=Phellinidium pouzarii TaxID=167371 RepID=A0A4S4LAZ0_9AGAM|nr:hypothetical protein EW145_g2529 [Phellinidium pouzarii]
MASVDDVVSLIPRAYQEEIFEHARRANVIAALDTGSGKTFIAALLIKWALSQPSAVVKKAIFLVPKVPLVDQQRDFLAAQTPLTVRGYKGAMGVDTWDNHRWSDEFKQADCLVMTAQIFKNVLTHGYWSLEQVSLLIFDECHHTQHHHPYNMIMTDHYAICKDKPRVFGMTASPIWNPRNPVLSIQTLQFNLFARVIAVREHAKQLDHFSNKPTEVILKYRSSPLFYATYYNPTHWEHLSAHDLLNISGLSIKLLQVRYEATLAALGPAGADYFLLNSLTVMVKERLRHDHEQSHDVSLIEKDLSDAEKQTAEKLDKLRFAITTFSSRINRIGDVLPSEWLSPKVLAVVNVLLEHKCEDFQGIIFVDQRQIASTLSWVLPRVMGTRGWIRCGELMGHGDTTNSESSKGMGINAQKDVVRSFRIGELNLYPKVVATSVAEEGLDFPACKLIIRFDPIHHMVGYLQSRGRARKHKSTYVVMVEENDVMQLERYEGFRNAEPNLKKVYERVEPLCATENEEDEQDDPSDLVARENYVIPSTGATLTYSSAIGILEHLCALIPRDVYTSSLRPKYSGDYVATVQLPHALPLAANQFTFTGPQKCSKKEAKRAVAFIAVRTLHSLGVFDDHFSPTKARQGEVVEDADGGTIANVNAVATMMDVLVVSPWKPGPPWYMYTVIRDDETCAGLISGNRIPEVELSVRGMRVELRCHESSQPMNLDTSQLDLLVRFTKLGIWWCVTSSPVTSSLACFLVPLNASGAIEWQVMEKAVENEIGTYDWSTVTERDEGKLVLMNARRFARPLLLKKFRLDLSLNVKPCLEATGEDFATYTEYFENTYEGNSKNVYCVPTPPGGPILEVSTMSRYPHAFYDHQGSEKRVSVQESSGATFLLPQSFCRRLIMPIDIIHAFQVFAPLCRRICDVFRAQTAQMLLRFPPVHTDLLIEALTLPCAAAGFSNQRLETLGDSVLKLSVITYIYNRFPNKHEGQLSVLKANSVSNRLLLARARKVKFERFLSGERLDIRVWQTVFPSVEDVEQYNGENELVPLVRRTIPRRSLQDCMEASLGASFVTGSIDMALRTGTALGLCFGGDVPWPKRYPILKEVPPAALFNKLQDDLQYKFRNGNLLLEAVKHASFDAQEGSCYQRLEFLGDAVIELIVTSFLYRKFPEANSGQLTRTRSRAICNATLAALAVKRLSLHKYLLANNVTLSKDIAREVDNLSKHSYEAVAINSWSFDPPKVLGDIFESVMGAMFVDNGFDYAHVAPIIERIMENVLNILNLDMPDNPVGQLSEWIAKAGKMQSNTLVDKKDSVAVLVHGHTVAGPIRAANISLAKGLASEKAKATLSDDMSEFALHRICDCLQADETISDSEPDLPIRDIREKDLDYESENGFALAGRVRLEEVERSEATKGEVMDEDDLLEDLDTQEVEMLLYTPTFELDDMDYS